VASQPRFAVQEKLRRPSRASNRLFEAVTFERSRVAQRPHGQASCKMADSVLGMSRCSGGFDSRIPGPPQKMRSTCLMAAAVNFRYRRPPVRHKVRRSRGQHGGGFIEAASVADRVHRQAGGPRRPTATPSAPTRQPVSSGETTD